MQYDLREIGAEFNLAGDFLGGRPYGSGHINDTFLAEYNQGGTLVRYIHQRINHDIFKDPVKLMNNIFRVTTHQRSKIAAEGVRDTSRRALTTLAGREGLPYIKDVPGNIWRTYIFIEAASTHDVIQTPLQAREAARAFGAFQYSLADFSGERLHETIKDFHNTKKRFQRFEKVLHDDPLGRAAGCGPEIDFAMGRKQIAGRLVDLLDSGQIPERITHNDTKLNNVMLDDETQEGVCVIDLDTVMPGLVLYDFGDMVRTFTSPVPEDEKDLAKVSVQMDYFEALTAGYMESAKPFLCREEKENLAFSGILLTFENGIRFLTDYLEGDVYFKITRDDHNLDRCRCQFALVQAMEDVESEMEQIVEKHG